MKKHYDNLQEFRGMAALLIVLSHIPFFENLIGSSWGGYGVTAFFLLSGFLLMHSTQKGADRFLIKRIARIIPLFWATTLFTFVVARVKPDWFNTTVATVPNLIKSLLFIPYVNPNGMVRPILDVSWALFPEVWLYVLFYFAMKVSHRYRGLLAGGVFIALYLLAVGPFRQNSIFNQYKLSFLCMPVGMAVYFAVKRWVRPGESPSAKVVVWLKPTLIFTFWAVSIAYNFLTVGSLNLVGVALTVLVFVAFILAEDRSQKARFFGWLGEISYSMYLIHEFVVKGTSRLLFSLESIDFITLLASLACTGIVICVAYAVNRWFEKPAAGLILNTDTKLC